MQDGAPVVADLHGVGGMILGNADAVVTGKREIPIRYAVVEAESLSASNFADGSRNPDYATPGKVVAINNGRTAGVVEAYRRGTAAKYRATIENAAATHGIPLPRSRP
ncbi:MAG: hypothetical protein IPJ52_09415 [Rhodocyclaceae bacterium]|nr:hypothetical protein [Rhodocyclaceae bacterium]